MSQKRKILHECECSRPDIRNYIKNGQCSEEQIIECHGKAFMRSLKLNLKENEVKEK
jgi:hypothetical protein